MSNSEMVRILMFDYEDLTQEKIEELCAKLPRKIIRWLGSNHPDNRTRKIFFKLTNIEIGRDTVINPNFVVSDGYNRLLSIGDRVAISPNVTIVCESAPNNSDIQKIQYVKEKLICRRQVVIEDDVWIGSNTVILPGVNVGKGSIVGAGSVVSKDVPPFCIVAGVPAKVIRSLK